MSGKRAKRSMVLCEVKQTEKNTLQDEGRKEAKNKQMKTIWAGAGDIFLSLQKRVIDRWLKVLSDFESADQARIS